MKNQLSIHQGFSLPFFLSSHFFSISYIRCLLQTRKVHLSLTGILFAYCLTGMAVLTKYLLEFYLFLQEREKKKHKRFGGNFVSKTIFCDMIGLFVCKTHTAHTFWHKKFHSSKLLDNIKCISL